MTVHGYLLGIALVASSSATPGQKPCNSGTAGAVRRPDPPAIAVRYVANAGVLLSIDGTDVLIDAPIREGIPPYATSDAAERARLEGARAPYDRVAAVLVTHWHEDHFDPEAVAAHLAHNRGAVLVSSPEVVARVRAIAPQLGRERLRAVLPPPGTAALLHVGSLAGRVLRVRHNPTRRLPEQHVGFLIGERAAVLHTGDADPAADNFAVLRGLPVVDVALVPFWYVQREANRRLVRDVIAARHIVTVHVPRRRARERCTAHWLAPASLRQC